MKKQIYIYRLGKSIKFIKPNGKYQQDQVFIVPDFTVFVKDAVMYGNLGALIRRIFQLNIRDIFYLAWIYKFKIFNILKKDFATGAIILATIELLQAKKFRPNFIIFSEYLTDLSVALNNENVFKKFINVAKEKLNFKIAFMTINPPSTLKILSKNNIIADYFIFPFNRFGYEMNPSKQEVENVIKFIEPQRIIAATPVFLKKDKEYLLKYSIDKVLIDWI
ncbi:MAG: hypothetical protein AAB441_00705 [Patescibacteria group bacterium]